MQLVITNLGNLVKLNLNEIVQVVLTESGAAAWNMWEAQFENLKYTQPKYKQEGAVVREPLWNIFQVFGSSIHLGGKVPFKNGDIIVGENV